MLTKALLVRLEALPGKEEELAGFRTRARSIVMEEPRTIAWFAIRFGPSTFGVHDLFPDDEAETPISPVAWARRSDPTPASSSPSRRSRRRHPRRQDFWIGSELAVPYPAGRRCCSASTVSSTREWTPSLR